MPSHPEPAGGRLRLRGVEPQRLLLRACPPVMWPYARFDVAGTDHVPPTGAVILAGNHRSYFDVPAIIQLMRGTGRTGRILAKREMFDVPLVGRLAQALGGIPVDRAGGGTDSMDAAAAALADGRLVCLLPQGTIPRGAHFYDPVLTGRTGAARLAAATGAPVVPFGIWGSDVVWPRHSPLPRMHTLVHPPTVRVRVGPPVLLGSGSPAEDTARIMAAIADLLPPEAREARTPTPEEVVRATPRSARSRPKA